MTYFVTDKDKSGGTLFERIEPDGVKEYKAFEGECSHEPLHSFENAEQLRQWRDEHGQDPKI